MGHLDRICMKILENKRSYKIRNFSLFDRVGETSNTFIFSHAAQVCIDGSRDASTTSSNDNFQVVQF